MMNRAYIRAAVSVAATTLALSVLCYFADRYIADGSGGPRYEIFKGLNLFSRSGALVALAGAVLEYQLSLSIYLRNIYTPGRPIGLLQLAEAANLTQRALWLRWFAHFNVAVGTLIWGYGDLAYFNWGKAANCVLQSSC